LLPHGSAARVDREKVEAYLLSETHPIGRMKAAYFRRLGFDRSRPEDLIRALAELAVVGTVVDREETRYGIKYVVEGLLHGGRGTDLVRTVWLAETPDDPPRLITAYPAPSGG